MPFWLALVIIISIVGGLGFATFAMWLDFQNKQAKAGASSSELAEAVAAQQKLLEAAERRIQNLEAIVTSEAWDAERASGLPDAAPATLGSSGRIDARLLDDRLSYTEAPTATAQRVQS
ncbi:MAG: hypothetical protein AAGJ10_09470 [Bacteroidota bacterium]